MTAQSNNFADEQFGTFAAEEIRLALHDIVASPAFAKAPRMRHLLDYLVKKKLSSQAHEVNEYAIGLEVFGRDPRSYDTGADPLVRVHAGRLRERLKAYYATRHGVSALHISIPLGNYVPQLRRVAPQPAVARATMLALAPLSDLGLTGNPVFVRGLDEELGQKLFKTFGSAMQLQEIAAVPAPDGQALATHRLEGSIRIESEHVRASVRLIDAFAGHVEWRSQFDGHGRLGMGLQEQLSGAICDGLQTYFAHAPA